MFKWLSPSKRELKTLSDAISKVEERLDELQSEHRKLRGRFYAARGEVSDPGPRQESKAEALARIGFVPGRPAPHNR